MSSVPADVLVAEFRRRFPTEARLVELELENEALRRMLDERQQPAGPQYPPEVAAALKDFDQP